MNDERIAKLEAYIAQEEDLKERIWREYMNKKYYTYGEGAGWIIILVTIIGCFIIGPTSIVLGIIALCVVPRMVENAKLDKATKGTGFDGKYKKIYRGVNYILSFFSATEKEINEMIDESVKNYTEAYHLLGKAEEKYRSYMDDEEYGGK